jgi:hypothetical protein
LKEEMEMRDEQFAKFLERDEKIESKDKAVRSRVSPQSNNAFKHAAPPGTMNVSI